MNEIPVAGSTSRGSTLQPTVQMHTQNERRSGRPRISISVVIPTYNAERTLEWCLDSLTWADEVVVVDMFSTDRTPEICERYRNVRFFQRVDYIFANVNFGIDQATGAWIIRHDSDEMITPELRDEILGRIADGSMGDYDGYHVADIVNHFGVWLPFGEPGKAGREKVFRKGFFRYPVQSEHEHPIITGRWGYLQNRYLHDSNPSLGFMLKKWIYYAERDAERRDVSEARSAWYIAYRTVKAFFSSSYRYWRQYGRMPKGLNPILSMMWAFQYFAAEGLVWEKHLPSAEQPESMPERAIVREFGSNL